MVQTETPVISKTISDKFEIKKGMKFHSFGLMNGRMIFIYKNQKGREKRFFAKEILDTVNK